MTLKEIVDAFRAGTKMDGSVRQYNDLVYSREKSKAWISESEADFARNKILSDDQPISKPELIAYLFGTLNHPRMTGRILFDFGNDYVTDLIDRIKYRID